MIDQEEYLLIMKLTDIDIYETLGDGPVRHSGPVHPTLSSNNILSIFFSKLS